MERVGGWICCQCGCIVVVYLLLLSLSLYSLSYLRRIVDKELPAVEYQIQKSRISWVRIGKIIRKQSNYEPKIMRTF
jgi:hypothetical protein